MKRPFLATWAHTYTQHKRCRFFYCTRSFGLFFGSGLIFVAAEVKLIGFSLSLINQSKCLRPPKKWSRENDKSLHCQIHVTTISHALAIVSRSQFDVRWKLPCSNLFRIKGPSFLNLLHIINCFNLASVVFCRFDLLTIRWKWKKSKFGSIF